MCFLCANCACVCVCEYVDVCKYLFFFYLYFGGEGGRVRVGNFTNNPHVRPFFLFFFLLPRACEWNLAPRTLLFGQE